jgi:hypothetical protein
MLILQRGEEGVGWAPELVEKQGDQILRFFAHWGIVYLGQLIKN